MQLKKKGLDSSIAGERQEGTNSRHQLGGGTRILLPTPGAAPPPLAIEAKLKKPCIPEL